LKPVLKRRHPVPRALPAALVASAVLAVLAVLPGPAWPCDDCAQGQPGARQSAAAPDGGTRSLRPVSLQGCVMDAGALPSHTAVHAMSTAGRLLATAHPDERGVWRMQVPPRTELRLVLGTASADARPVLKLNTSADDLVVDGCVIDLH
jgi:hypothetical protein